MLGCPMPLKNANALKSLNFTHNTFLYSSQFAKYKHGQILKGSGDGVQHLNCWSFGLCPLSGTVKNTLFWKLDLFPYSGQGLAGTYSVGSIEKSWPQSLSNLCQYNCSYIIYTRDWGSSAGHNRKICNKNACTI
jgi:hypothetical protein